MQAVDQQVLSSVSNWLESGKSCWLATVVATYGSSPRPEGSLMACESSGIFVGSLSGGCVEEDLLEKLLRGELAQHNPQFFRYGETDEEAERLGLPCGGHLDIVVEPIQPNEQTCRWFRHISDRLASRESIRRIVNLKSGTQETSEPSGYLPFSYDPDRGVLDQTYGPRYQLFIIGTGMVSSYVADLGQTLDYQVTVIDPRVENLNSFSVEGVTKVCDMPDDVIRARANDAQSAIIALSHDPRIDDMGLMGAFETDAFYIGAMGSDRTSAKRRQRLIDLEISDSNLARLHAPIGLPIGSKTPPEIAISIMAEITLVRHGISNRQQKREDSLEIRAVG